MQANATEDLAQRKDILFITHGRHRLKGIRNEVLITEVRRFIREKLACL